MAYKRWNVQAYSNYTDEKKYSIIVRKFTERLMYDDYRLV